jgi:hypothetical protein
LFDIVRQLFNRPLLYCCRLFHCRLITVNTIKVPEGVDWAKLVKNAMDKFNLEIAGGAWRGCNSIHIISTGTPPD